MYAGTVQYRYCTQVQYCTIHVFLNPVQNLHLVKNWYPRAEIVKKWPPLREYPYGTTLSYGCYSTWALGGQKFECKFPYDLLYCCMLGRRAARQPQCTIEHLHATVAAMLRACVEAYLL